MEPYSNYCECGKSFDDNNCAHYLTNWMILNNIIEPYPDNCECCDSGRPIRAKEVRDNVFKNLLNLKSHDEPQRKFFVTLELVVRIR